MMETQPASGSPIRRSDRLPICYLVEVSGIHGEGHFSEEATTTNVSRHGCCILPKKVLRRSKEVYLRRDGTETKVLGRIVNHVVHPNGENLYGIELSVPGDKLWGVGFSPSFHERLLDGLHEGVYFVNLQKKITYWNRGAEKLAGFTASEAVGKHCFDSLLGHVDHTGKSLCDNGCPLSKTIADGQPREAEVYLRHKLGHRVPVCMRVMPMRDSADRIIGAVEVFSDVTAKKRIESRVNELEHLAFHDPLTSLPNRRYIEFKLTQALQEHKQFGREYGLLMIDVDRFKQVNDVHGHEVGDTILRAIATTLTKGLRSEEIVGRWGGEEFLALLPDVDASQIGDVAERCRRLVSQSVIPAGSSCMQVTVSIGGTFLNNSISAKGLISRVDALMYKSKQNGRNCSTIG